MHNAKSLACRLSRLRVLAIIVPACCLSLALASRTDAQQPPRKDRPFDAADVERTTGYAHGTANPDTGQLTAGVNARCGGYQTSGAGEARPFVRWVYRYEGRQDVKATVLAKYTFSPGDMSISVESPESGGGDVRMAFGIRVTDTADPSACLEFPLEIYAAVQLLVPAESSDGFRGQRAAVTFKPGHTYYIDAYLDLYGGVYGGESHTPTQPAPGGTVTASASATVEALSLQTMARPWIMASITRMVPITHDTWDLYERALKEVTGREYFATGFWAEVSAGGAYDPNQSRVVIEAPKSVLLKVKDSPLPSNLADNAITLQLPNPYDLPLEGATWHFLVLLDPEFDLTQDLPVKLNVPPLIAPLLGTWDVTSRKALASPAVERLPQTAMPITEFYSGKNWFLIVPASLLVPAGGLRPAAGPVKSRMGPEVPPPEEVTSQAQFTWPIFAAPGVQPREVALPGIAFEPVEPPTFAVEPPWLSKEPGLMIPIGDLWSAIALPNPPSRATEPTIPPAIADVWGRLYNYYADKRGYWQDLSYQAPDRRIYHLPELGKALRLEPGDVQVAIPDLRAVPALPPSSGVSDGWGWPRFAWQQQVRSAFARGYVRSRDGVEASSADRRDYTVYFEFVPRQQPWALAAPEACLYEQ